MKTEKLRIKDLVTIGIFTVIYFVVMFISGMPGMIPILFLANPAIAGITTGIVNDAVYGEDSKTLCSIYFRHNLCSYCICDGKHIYSVNSYDNYHGNC